MADFSRANWSLALWILPLRRSRHLLVALLRALINRGRLSRRAVHRGGRLRLALRTIFIWVMSRKIEHELFWLGILYRLGHRRRRRTCLHASWYIGLYSLRWPYARVVPSHLARSPALILGLLRVLQFRWTRGRMAVRKPTACAGFEASIVCHGLGVCYRLCGLSLVHGWCTASSVSLRLVARGT